MARHRRIEVHVLDFDGEFYGENVVLEIVDRIRDEKKFANVDELSARLAIDKNLVQNRL